MANDGADHTLAEFACLGVIALGPSHGWAVASALNRQGSLGRVWSLSRPLTYRAIDSLVSKGLVRREGNEPGHGPTRTKLSITPDGTQTCEHWLNRPVEHIREVRTVFLLKLAVGGLLGRNPEPLLRAQRETFAPLFAALGSRRHEEDPVDLWRDESSRAVGRFLDRALAQHEPHQPEGP